MSELSKLKWVTWSLLSSARLALSEVYLPDWVQHKIDVGWEWSVVVLKKKKVANLVGAFYKGKTRDKNREDPSGFLMRICIFYCQER